MPIELDIDSIRPMFPALHQQVYGRDLVYFDNAATTQKPQQVIDALTDYYAVMNSNIHRGVHYLSQQATTAFEESRKDIARFINAARPHEIIFTRGTTESINLVASSFGKRFLGKDDEVIVSGMEHHSNIVPWQMSCAEHGATLRVLPFDISGELCLDQLPALMNGRTRIIAITHVSNTLGTVNDIREIIRMAHERNIPVLIDGAQAVAHLSVDVQELDCDFYCFSGHKMYAPMGVGILYGKEKLLEELPPYQGGGEMIKNVSFEKTTYNELPFKFEAGTPNVGDVIGLDVAIKFLQMIGLDRVAAYEHELLTYASEQLQGIGGLKLVGTAAAKTAVLSFNIDTIHPYDAGTILDKMGIAVRTGHHCTQPVMDFLKIPGTIRASFAMYNTKAEIDLMTEAILKVKEMFL